MCVLYFGWPNQPSSGTMKILYSTHIKTFLRCAGFCLYSIHKNNDDDYNKNDDDNEIKNYYGDDNKNDNDNDN